MVTTQSRIQTHGHETLNAEKILAGFKAINNGEKTLKQLREELDPSNVSGASGLEV